MSHASDETGQIAEPSDDVVVDFDNNAFFSPERGHDERTWSLQIAMDRATTKNKIALILVVALVSSFPAYAVSLWLVPSLKQELIAGYQQWLVVMGSLTGAAVGVGAMASQRNS